MPPTLTLDHNLSRRISHRFAPSGQTRMMMTPPAAGEVRMPDGVRAAATHRVSTRREDPSREAEIAVLSCDLKGFTAFADAHAPLDVVTLLDRVFTALGDQILSNNGVIYQYAGDQVIGLFGVDGTGTAAEHCRQAVRAGLGMLDALPDLNARLADEFETEVDVRIGAHFGRLVLGYLGHPSRRVFSAIGDAMNVACRVEAANKDLETRFLVSRSLFQRLPTEVEIGRRAVVTLKGKRRPYPLVEVKRFVRTSTVRSLGS